MKELFGKIKYNKRVTISTSRDYIMDRHLCACPILVYIIENMLQKISVFKRDFCS